MKPTESIQKYSVPVHAGEFKIKSALLRRLVPLKSFLCAALVWAALPAAAQPQPLIVSQNPAYINDPLTFTYTPSTDPNACQPSWNETAKNYRDLTIYTGGTTEIDLPMSLNPDGVTFSGSYTTTSDDLGDNWLYIGDDVCGNVASLEWSVIEFGGWFVYNATWVDATDVAALKSPGNSVEVDAVSFPPNNNASTLYDWSLSGDCINWRQDNWGGYASRNNPYEYYYCVSLDDFQTVNWLNVWVISAVLKTLNFTSATEIVNNNTDWTDGSGVANTKPDWTPTMNNPNPLCQKMGTTVTVTATVNVEPPGLPYRLTASSNPSYLDFGASDWKEANGSDQTIDMTASTLPNHVCATSDSIDWFIDAFDDRTLFNCLTGNTGPHKFYVTYDKPSGTTGQSGNVVTEHRLAHACAVANGLSSSADIAPKYFSDASSYGDINLSIYPPIGGQTGNYENAWEIMGFRNLLSPYNQISGADCISQMTLMSSELDMVGLSGSKPILVQPCHMNGPQNWVALVQPPVGGVFESDLSDESGILGYKNNLGFNQYEGCCYFNHTYYQGLTGGVTQNKAWQVLYWAAGQPGSPEHQIFCDHQNDNPQPWQLYPKDSYGNYIPPHDDLDND